MEETLAECEELFSRNKYKDKEKGTPSFAGAAGQNIRKQSGPESRAQENAIQYDAAKVLLRDVWASAISRRMKRNGQSPYHRKDGQRERVKSSYLRGRNCFRFYRAVAIDIDRSSNLSTSRWIIRGSTERRGLLDASVNVGIVAEWIRWIREIRETGTGNNKHL